MKGTFAQKLSKAVSKFSGNLIVKTMLLEWQDFYQLS